MGCTDPLLTAAENQERLDAVLLQIGVPLPSETRLHLVVPIKILQSGLGDVDPTTGGFYSSVSLFDNYIIRSVA